MEAAIFTFVTVTGNFVADIGYLFLYVFIYLEICVRVLSAFYEIGVEM